MPKQLMAIHAIQHKPKTKVETVAPGSIFTPKDDDEREFFLRAKAARELTAEETKAAPKQASGGGGKKAAPKKADPAPEGDTDKGVSLDSEPGEAGAGTSDDTDMLD